MRITNAWLLAHNACIDQVDLFRAEWPDGAKITEAAVLRAAGLGLNLDWLAKKLFTAQAWDEYERVRDSARAEYERVRAPAFWRCWQMCR